MKKILFIFMTLTLFSCRQGDKETVLKLQAIEKVNRLFIETDNKNWKAVSEIFTGDVLFDMSSMTGAKPATIASKEIVAGWENGLKEIKFIHHQTGNYIVKCSDKEADVFCYGVAYHFRPVPSGNNVRTFVGSYDFHLVRSSGEWKIDRFKFNLKFIDGNKNL